VYVETLDNVVVNRTADAFDAFDILFTAVEDLARASDSFESFQNGLRGLISPGFINELGDLLMQSMLQADSIGRSEIINMDRVFSKEEKVLPAKYQYGPYTIQADGIQWIEAAGPGAKISFNLTPLEAWDYFRNKAFWISGIENEKFFAEVKRSLELTLAEGRSYADFTSNFRQLYESYGITPDNAIRLDTIFRTNMFTAYTAGLVKQVEQVKDRFPVWRYVSILDNRTRQSHRNLNGKLFRRGPYPPISFNCRCTPQFLHRFQLERISEPVYDSIYEFIDRDEVVDFLSGSSFESWLSDNPVSPDVQSTVEGLLN